MKLYFIRHGESEANLLGEISNRGDRHPLTERGIQQAAALAQNLRKLPLSGIFASPLLRARQTAQILGDALGIPVAFTPALREYDCGLLEGRADPAAWAIYWQVNNAWLDGDWAVHPRGGESFADMQNRFQPFIEDLLTANGEDVLLVSHGGLYRLMLPLLLTNIDFDWAQDHPIDNTAYVLAETTTDGLVCLEWSGIRFSS